MKQLYKWYVREKKQYDIYFLGSFTTKKVAEEYWSQEDNYLRQIIKTGKIEFLREI